MKTKIYSFFSSFFLLLISVLGFHSCDKEVLSVCEYGTPSADFKLSGEVLNDQEEAIKGIKVVLLKSYDGEDGKIYYRADSVSTSNLGAYSFEFRDFPTDTDYTLECTDVDGAENGLYETTIVSGSIPFTDAVGGEDDTWYEGAVEKTENVTMQSPNNDEE